MDHIRNIHDEYGDDDDEEYGEEEQDDLLSD